MIAAIFKSAGVIEIDNKFPLRKLKKGEVIIEVANCGICGTDKHIFEGKAYAETPVILGHEYSGTVVELSDKSVLLKIGDKVAVDPNIYCGKCSECKKGNVHFCRNHQALGVTKNGGFAQYSIVPFSQVYLLPDNSDLSIAAFAEPLSCCLRGMQHANIKHGDSVVVIGGGSIGLIMIQLAKISGAAKIILIEPENLKRKLALKLGADLSISPFEADVENNISEYTSGGADVVIECAGKKEAVEMSVKISRKGGRVIIFGMSAKGEKVTLDLQYLFQKELQIFNSFLNPFTFGRAVELIISNKINFSSFVTKQIMLENINEAFNSSINSIIIKQQVSTKK
ncbi:MAG: zinc-dependent alcohol dehydrogenase family protein [Bacteroidetes bacterium]|nr:zinc-dependent alcohol dehydrogenase family protein [Bacteroidota bacterium]